MVRSCKWWCKKKKLEEAAQYWAATKPTKNNQGVENDLHLFGLQNNSEALEWLQGVESKTAETDFEIYPENEESLVVFLALQTNWIISVGMGGVIFQGINYSTLESVLRLKQIPRKRWPSLFDDIRILEMSAISLLNQKA